MPPLKLVMMGTGDFAVPTFTALYATPHPVIGLFTQPERAGQGHHRPPGSRIKQIALDHGTPVYQPENVNTSEVLADLRGLNADVFVVAAYGQILSEELLRIPRRAAINVHASLLPKYRGAAPVAYAILKGETETGVSIIQILPQLDAGPVLAVARTPIGPRETAGELEGRLAAMAPPLTAGVLDQIATNSTQPVPQDPTLMTRAPKLRKTQGEIDWRKPAHEIDRLVRAMQPWPKAFTFIHTADKPPLRVLLLEVQPGGTSTGSPPGAVVHAGKEGLAVQSGDGVVEILRIQPEGKRPMTATEFLRGHSLRPDERLGAENARD